MFFAETMCNVWEMQAHRVALGSASRALAVVLSAYGNGDVVRIDLTDFRRDTVAQILKYIYTARLTLDCSTIAEVNLLAR
jgi:BTB/POZ domain